MPGYAVVPAQGIGAQWAARVPGFVELTVLQGDILRFIAERKRLWDRTPFYREIAEAVGLAGTGPVHREIARLSELGLLFKAPRLHGSIVLLADIDGVTT